MTDETPATARDWYALHDHGYGDGRHSHHVDQGHAGDVNNPRANDHAGVERITFAEFALSILLPGPADEPTEPWSLVIIRQHGGPLVLIRDGGVPTAAGEPAWVPLNGRDPGWLTWAEVCGKGMPVSMLPADGRGVLAKEIDAEVPDRG